MQSRGHILKVYACSVGTDLTLTRVMTDSKNININFNDFSLSSKSSGDGSSSQASITQYAVKSMTKSKSNKISQLVLQFIVGDLRPVNVVEGEHFANLLKYLEPNYDLPGRHFFVCKLEQQYETEKANLKSKLEKMSFLALMVDMWSSCRMDSYLGVTCHYICDENIDSRFASLSLKSNVIATKVVNEAHTSENLARWINAVLDDYNINPCKVVGIVTDNGANIVKAIRILQDQHSSWLHFRCAAHSLQLCISDCNKTNGIDRALGK